MLGILQYINPLGQAHARFARYLTIYPQDPTSKCRVRPQSCKHISTLYPILHALPKLTLILHAVTRGCVIPHRLRRPQAPIRTYHGKSFFLTLTTAKRCFRVRWVHNLETRQQFLSVSLESCRLSTMSSSSSAGRRGCGMMMMMADRKLRPYAWAQITWHRRA